jgi:dTDP-4-amino-4,6-dideoxygalactose transaminase
VEDAAHSPGAFASDSDGTNYSSGNCKFSDASCLSFHPVKHICCGEGGAVLTNDDGLANLMKNERSHGIVRPHGADHDTPWFYEQRKLGWNYRLTDMQAALGSSQLNSLDEQLQERRNLADRYHHYLSLPPFDGFLSAPSPSPGHAWHLYIIRFLEPGMRDAAHKFLKDKGIMTQVHYVPIYRHPYYERIHGKIHLPGAEKFYHSCLSIPFFPTLKEKEQDRVIHELKNFLQSR